MIIAFDTEFIDTPEASELLSIGFFRADGRELYLEFPYTEAHLTPWLRQNVLPYMHGEQTPFARGAAIIREFVGGSKFDRPEFWAYYASYDWYWLSRLFGGMLNMPEHWPHLPRDLAYFQQRVPIISGPEHHALNDAKSVMAALQKRIAVPTDLGRTKP